MGVDNGFSAEVEEVILQVLGHKERRKILKILASAPGGVSYSGILGDTGLSTGRLNYHLKELAGFIERGEERRYRLTALGKKALGVLRFTTEDLSVEYEGYVSAARANRRKFIKKNLDRAFYFFTALFLVGSGAITYLLWRVPEGHWVLAIIWAFSLVIIYVMDKIRRKSPQHIMGFIDWLEWKLFDENGGGGSQKFHGSRLVVGLVVGVIIGAAMGKVGLGILLGLFLGAAMNI
ncbi:MAG: winged helix-turn-helix transcriptional regulator [Candidatus Bathyarchaeota archaeon]|nr:MAG: winged helix-turn-helix transcriptional regulator [Candidatus Bathyarchaeota archaeon]